MLDLIVQKEEYAFFKECAVPMQHCPAHSLKKAYFSSWTI